MIAICSFFFAAFVAIAATIAIEKFGGKLGGILGSIPTTIVPASIGMWFIQEQFEYSMCSVPVGMTVNACFLACWRYIPPYLENLSFWTKLGTMICISLMCWLLLAFGSLMIIQSFQDHIWWIGWSAFLIQITLGIIVCMGNPPAPKGKNNVGLQTLLLRGVLAGIAIGVSIIIAKSGHPILAGIASVFPAIFLTTMISVWISQGESVQLGAVGPMMLGSSAVSFYALICLYVFSNLSWMLGSFIAWILSILICSFPSFFWLSRQKIKK